MTTAMPPMRRIATNGIELAVHDPGGESALPPIVLCHGFPEIAFSWRHQLAALPAAGLRVIAPDQRGYGASDRPAPVEAYDMEALTGDLVGLLDAYGWEKAVFCGHDWGGFVVWQMGARYPERTAGVIGLNTPYTKRPPIDPIALYRQRFGDDFYIVSFQTPDAPEARFEADLDKTFRFFLRKSDLSPAAFEALPPERRTFSLETALAHYDPATDRNQFLSGAEIDAYVAAFSVSGFRGPINWYRNFTRNWERSAHIADHVAAPSLMIMAEDDLVLPPSAADGMEKYVPNLTKALVKGSGHWTQQEQPNAVNRLIIDWMVRTFG
jgi:pimeloyl-ACP methyl ester carboxylesterase